MDAAPRTKVLLAVGVDKTARMERILSGHEVVKVETCEDARVLLEQEEFGLVILGVHFDESQMFSLLGDIRAHAAYRKVPILCVLGHKGRVLSDVAIEGLDHAVKAMTANGFLNLENIPDDDDGNGNARIRRIVDYLILIDGDLQQVAATWSARTTRGTAACSASRAAARATSRRRPTTGRSHRSAPSGAHTSSSGLRSASTPRNSVTRAATSIRTAAKA